MTTCLNIVCFYRAFDEPQELAYQVAEVTERPRPLGLVQSSHFRSFSGFGLLTFWTTRTNFTTKTLHLQWLFTPNQVQSLSRSTLLCLDSDSGISTSLYSASSWRIRSKSRTRCRVHSEKRYWRLRRLESAVPAQLALKNVTLRKGRDTLCKVRQSGTCCAEREQPICTASRWQLMESLSGTAVSSTVAIVGSIWPKGPAQAGPATQAQWVHFVRAEET